MPVDVNQIANYFASSSPAALSLFQFFLPLMYVALAVVIGVGAFKFFIGIFGNGIKKLFHLGGPHGEYMEVDEYTYDGGRTYLKKISGDGPDFIGKD